LHTANVWFVDWQGLTTTFERGASPTVLGVQSEALAALSHTGRRVLDK